MKTLKVILTVIIITMACNVQAQQDTTKYVTDSDTEKLIDKYSGKVDAAITSIANKLERPAKHIYGILIKQQKVYAWGSLIGVMMTILFFVLCLIWGIREEFDEPEPVIACVFSGAALIVAVGIFLSVGLTGFINPEYGALQDIMNMIK